MAELPDSNPLDAPKVKVQAEMKRWRSLQLGSLCGLMLGGVALVWLGWTGDRLKTASLRINDAWLAVDAGMQERDELSGQLLQVSHGTIQEQNPGIQTAIKNLANARKVWGSAQTIPDKIAATAMMDSALDQFQRTVLPASPTLRSNPLFLSLSDRIGNAESVFAGDRHQYNALAQAYNQDLQRWPTQWVAGGLGFQPQPLFDQKP